MKVGLYQYGEGGGLEGLRIGVARQVPRGVKREEYVPGGYFDVWLPLVAPSAELVKNYQAGEVSTKQFFRSYRSEMRVVDKRHVIELLAAMATRSPIHLGCFCADESRCHRSALLELVLEALEDLPPKDGSGARYSSSPCSMPDPED
ncbi:DUF488 domain-containing protein [Haloferula chungangensis]|uniref:DUF488 domain-containing protein n=1 Tax=Haloferula chungangensis TaxID=1048331 RepID=A0ABW2LAN3_9BACT